MRSSLGFHTFTIFLRLTESEALKLYKDFQECSNVRVRPIGNDEKKHHSLPNGYAVEYKERGVGLSWYMRFSSQVDEYSISPKH